MVVVVVLIVRWVVWMDLTSCGRVQWNVVFLLLLKEKLILHALACYINNTLLTQILVFLDNLVCPMLIMFLM